MKIWYNIFIKKGEENILENPTKETFEISDLELMLLVKTIDFRLEYLNHSIDLKEEEIREIDKLNILKDFFISIVKGGEIEEAS